MLRTLAAALASMLALLAAVPAQAADHTVVIFPFTVGTSAGDISGAEISDRIAADFPQSTAIKLIVGSKTAKPTEYREAAKALGADYYYTGSVAAVGTSYSAIEQLVTTKGGTVIWSATMNFRAVSDIRGEGSRVYAELMRGATPPPAAASPAAASPAPAAGASAKP